MADNAALHVLVVEDDEASRILIQRMLERAGHSCTGAATLVEAFRVLRVAPPPCVILDLMLPDGDGLALLEHIRAKGLEIHVALCTAVHHADEVEEIRALRPDAIFKKPLDMIALLEWVSNCR